MFTKFSVSSITDACDCPFYRTDTNGDRRCFFKSIVQLPLAMAMMDRPSAEFDPENWENDCGGTFKHCTFVPLLYTAQAESGETSPAPYSEAATQIISIPASTQIPSSLDDYDPFSDEEESEISVKKQDDAPQSLKHITVEASKPTPSVRVSVHKVSNPFLVKTDVLVYPTNNLLMVDDPYLHRMSQGRVQDLCDQVPRPIVMGNIYVTTNGGSYKGGVVAPVIYHAVVAGASRLVNNHDIGAVTRKALLLAEASGAKTIAMMPCDCGTHDLNQVAMAQLAAIRQFLRNTKTENLQRVFIVMNDDESVAAFEDYFGRIFE